MRLRTEIIGPGQPDEEEEIVIRCKSYGDDVSALESAVRRLLSEEKGISLDRDGTEFYLPHSEILFFETDGRRVVAHTARDLFYARDKLFTLDRSLPPTFVRASKSCIVNAAAVFSVRRGVTGVTEIGFRNTEKKAYISRSYFKSFSDKMEDIRRYLLP